MKLGLLCVEMVIFVFLGNIEADFPDDLPSSCPRDKSRLVRTIIDKKILPIFDRYRIEMPIECPFHPHRDLLWWPEDNLSAYIFDGFLDNDKSSPSSTFSIISITETLASFFISIWRCPLCFKLFDCSERLAHHWDYDHRLYRHRTENFVCLSDFCDFIRCDILTRRRIYPTIGTSKYLSRMISSTLSINSGDLSPPNSAAILGPQNCNQTEMISLEKRCRITVRQCLLPLLISKITIKDFHDIEDDLVKEACGYLDCDKFFDLTIHEESARPLSFCLLMGIVMIGGFLICYYIVWYLFESTIVLKRARLELIRRERQAKGNRPPSSLRSSPSPTPPTSDKMTLLPGSGGQVKRQWQLVQDQFSSKAVANAATTWKNYRYVASSSRRSGESETSQEDASPGSSESRYIVTHPIGSRRYQRPSHLYLASELALLLEKRSMETVPEFSDDQISPGVNCLSKVSSFPPPAPPPSSTAQSTYHRPSSAGATYRSGLTRSNVAIVSKQNDESQMPQGSQDFRQNSSRSMVSIQRGNSMVSPVPSTSDHIPNYYPSRRRDFALKGRHRNRYEGDDYTFDDEENDELITAITTSCVNSSTKRPQSVQPTTIIKTNQSSYGVVVSDAEVARYHYDYSRGVNSKVPNEYRSSRGVLFSTRNHDKRRCEFNFEDDDGRSSSGHKSSSRSTNEAPSTRIMGRSERGRFKFDRDSSVSASDTVTTTGLEIESEPAVSVTSGRRFCRPGMVRSISSTGAIRRSAMISQRSQESPITVPTPTIPTGTLNSGAPNQSRYRLTKSQSMDNPVSSKNKQSARSTHR